MANNVAASGTLTASTVATITLNDAMDSISVMTQAATGIYFTVGADGVTPTAPTVGGADCYATPPVAGGVTTVRAPQEPVVVSMISAGAAGYTVMADVDVNYKT